MTHARRDGAARERTPGPGVEVRSSAEPRSLSLRQSWCRAGEPIRWVFAQRRVRFDVVGLDHSGVPVPGRRRSADTPHSLAPDVTVFGLGTRSRSMSLLSRERIAGRQAPSEVDLDVVPADWVLTTQRLAAVVVTGAPHTSATASRHDDPERPLRTVELVSWLEIDRREITAVHETRRSARPVCRVLLHDGSGFDFHTSREAVRDMVDMAHGRA